MKKLLVLLFLIFISYNSQSQTYLIFGGDNHDVFLGCLNCNPYDDGSIWNSYGDYGSTYSDKSIWNSYGDYGGEYSDNSPFNEYASYPPVIVDPDGNFYGYFTADEYFRKRTNLKLAHIILRNWEYISEDVDRAYEEIFQ